MSLEPDLIALLKRLKLGRVLPTLPDRLALARAQKLDYAALLTLILADEVQRRDNLALDRRHLNELFSLQFLQKKEHVLLIGPVGVGKTFIAQALGAAATRAGHSVLFRRADLLLPELGQARADHTFEAVFRRYLTPDLLVTDDFGLHRLTSSSPRTSTPSSSSAIAAPVSSSPRTATSANGSACSPTHSLTRPSTAWPAAPTSSSSKDPATAPSSPRVYPRRPLCPDHCRLPLWPPRGRRHSGDRNRHHSSD